MALLLANLIAIVVLGILVLRQGPDPRIKVSPPAPAVRIVACIVLGIPLAIFLVFGIGEMVGGDLSGAMHLLQALFVILLGVLAWMRPFEGGVTLCLCGVAVAGLFLFDLMVAPSPEGSVLSPALIILALLPLLAGTLFLITGILARRARP